VGEVQTVSKPGRPAEASGGPRSRFAPFGSRLSGMVYAHPVLRLRSRLMASSLRSSCYCGGRVGLPRPYAWRPGPFNCRFQNVDCRIEGEDKVNPILNLQSTIYNRQLKGAPASSI
jgi:hypothetical protein